MGATPMACVNSEQTAHGQDARATRGGFTIVEILATMAFLGIVLPSILAGMTLCLSVAGNSKMRAEAAGLAQSKMAELLAQDQWDQSAFSGDFGQDCPDYKWSAQIFDWGSDGLVEQLDVTVSWRHQGKNYSVTLTTLIPVTATETSS
jgi:type II secretory pathway pseudopilin PulG